MKTLAESMQQYATQFGLDDLEGIKETAIDGVWFYRSSKGNSRQPFVYQSGIIVLGQGYKNIHIGQSPVRYGPDDYLVVGVPMPLECEAIAVDNELARYLYRYFSSTATKAREEAGITTFY